MRRWAIVGCVSLAACGNGAAGASPRDAGAHDAVGSQTDGADGVDGGAADAAEEPVYLEEGVDEVTTPVCAAPLQDAGFSTLAELPVASLCAQSGDEVWQGGPPCQGSVVVSMPVGIDGNQWWLFSASTGALEAVGGGVDGDFACSGGMAGFQFPYQCFNNRGWPLQTNLCPDAGG